jgi:hypothetical protein
VIRPALYRGIHGIQVDPKVKCPMKRSNLIEERRRKHMELVILLMLGCVVGILKQINVMKEPRSRRGV